MTRDEEHRWARGDYPSMSSYHRRGAETMHFENKAVSQRKTSRHYIPFERVPPTFVSVIRQKKENLFKESRQASKG